MPADAILLRDMILFAFAMSAIAAIRDAPLSVFLICAIRHAMRRATSSRCAAAMRQMPPWRYSKDAAMPPLLQRRSESAEALRRAERCRRFTRRHAERERWPLR